jgi:hypothetical protein
MSEEERKEVVPKTGKNYRRCPYKTDAQVSS